MPCERLRLDMLDVVDRRGEDALVDRRDAVGDVLGGQGPCIFQMMLTTGMLISGSTSVGVVKQDEGCRQQDQDGHHDERVWPLEGNVDYPH